MNIVSADLKDMLISEVSLGLIFATNLFIGRFPSTPDNCVTIFDVSGRKSDTDLSGDAYERPYAYIQIRNNSYVTGYELAKNIEHFLLTQSQTIWNDTLYTLIRSESGISSEDWDGNNNTMFTINLEIQRRPQAALFYDFIVALQGNGTTDPVPGTYAKERDEWVTAYAIPDDTYTFKYWLVNGIKKYTQQLLIQIKELTNAIAEFEGSWTDWYQSIIGISDTEVTDNTITNYGSGGSAANVDIGNVQVLKLDGVGSYVESPEIILGDSFVIRYKGVLDSNSQQYSVLFGKPSTIGYIGIFRPTLTNTEYKFDFYPNGGALYSITLDLNIDTKSSLIVDYNNGVINIYQNEILIHNHTIDNVSGFLDAYKYTLGIRAASYSTPMPLEAHLLEIDDILKYNFQSQQGAAIRDNSGNGNDGTLINANLTEAWGTKSDETDPIRYINGFNKVLVNEVAGASSILASPDGSNVGDEEVVNGDFSDVSKWYEPIGASIINEQLVYNGTAIGNSYTLENEPINTVIIGNIYKLEFEIISYTVGLCRVKVGNTYNETHELGKHIQYLTAATTEVVRVQGGIGSEFVIDNISVKEVTSIPAYGEWEFDSNKYSNKQTTFINNNNLGYPSSEGYMFQIYAATNKVSLYIVNSGTGVNIMSSANGYIDNTKKYKFKIQRNSTTDEYITGAVGTFAVYIKGGTFLDWTLVDVTGGVGTNPILDNTYTTTKFIVADNDAGDELSQLSKDGVLYNMSDFVDGTGDYKVRYDVGIDGQVDVNGVALQYKPRHVTDSEELLQNKDDVTLNAEFDKHAELGVLKYPNKFDFNILNAIDLTGIPESTFKMTKVDNANIKQILIKEDI